MAVPTISLYAGDFPNRADPQAKFSYDVGTFLPYFDTIGPEYNTMANWVNTQVGDIDQAFIDGQAAIDASVAEAEQIAVDCSNSAADAADSATLAQSNANFKGQWSDLTGSLNIPSAVEHNGKNWQLLNNLADVTASEPGVTTDWQEIKTGASVVVVSGNFTAEAGNIYMISTADITLPVIAVGEVFEFHAITDNVRVLNPSYTLSNGVRSISAGDDLLLKNGQTVKLVVTTSNNMEVI